MSTTTRAGTGGGETAGGQEVTPEEVVTGLTARLEAGQLLGHRDVEALAGLCGGQQRRAANRFAGAVNAELRQARRRRPRRTFWQWMFGPVQTSPEPLPDGLVRVLLRIQSGEPIGRQDGARLARAAGRPLARILETELRQASRTKRRGWGW